MEVKPGYKQTEVGIIPQEWAFEALAAHTISSAYGPRFSGEYYDERGNVALLRTTDLDDEGNLSLAQMPRAKLSLEQFKAHLLLVGDFLVSRSGTCGLATVFPGYEIPVLPGAFLIRVRFSSRIDARFLKLYFNSELGKRHLQQLTEGGVQKNIRGSALVELRFPLPSADEQRAIGMALSDVDGLLGGLDRLIAKKRDLKQAAMQQLLTGQTRLPGFHGEWEVKPLGGLARLYQSETIGQSLFTVDGFPVYGANGIIGRYDRWNHSTPQITISCRGNCGTVNRTEKFAWITGNAMVVNLDANKEVDHDFMFHLLKSQDFSVLVTGSGQPQIVRGPLSEFQIHVPKDRPEQTAIAEVLTEMDAELAALEQRREKTRALKQAMMQELLTGKTRLV